MQSYSPNRTHHVMETVHRFLHLRLQATCSPASLSNGSIGSYHAPVPRVLLPPLTRWEGISCTLAIFLHVSDPSSHLVLGLLSPWVRPGSVFPPSRSWASFLSSTFKRLWLWMWMQSLGSLYYVVFAVNCNSWAHKKKSRRTLLSHKPNFIGTPVVLVAGYAWQVLGVVWTLNSRVLRSSSSSRGFLLVASCVVSTMRV